MVAIVSLGATRVSRYGRAAAALATAAAPHGDLLVMGGRASALGALDPQDVRPTGPRISIQFRPHDVR